ncbi:MAG: HIT family protein [Pseudomonadales bacterium]|nr:HIT family protein [Pseudomonadales bacterium]
MNEFKLDPQLEKDCVVLGKLQTSQLLLMNNSLVPWFILVPEVEATEIYQLDIELQKTLLDEVNQMSKFVSDEYGTDKLNVAAIGNIVSQLHVHIVGRKKDDFCWPNVIWGTSQKKPYTDQELSGIVKRVSSYVTPLTPQTLR